MAQLNLSGSIGVPGSQSVLGNVNVVMANANHTLLPAEYSNKFLNVTSSVSLSVTRNLIAPLNQGQEFTIQNNTTGGQAVQIIGTSGAGITITNGRTVSVVCDGSHYLLANGSGTPDATIVTYEPTNPVEWSPPPSVVSDALDQLAARGGSGNATELQGYPISTTPPTDGYVLTWNGSDWTPEASGGGTPFVAGGDLSGSNTNQTVIGLDTVPLNISSLNTGNALQYNGSHWINSPINFAGGANYVSGVVPAGNLPAATTSALGVIKLSNDLAGTDTSPEVAGLLNHTLPSLTDGYLNWTGSAWALSPVSGGASDASEVTYEPADPGNWNTPPTEVAQALDELAAETVGIAPTTVIFMPGGTPGGNIYTTESSLVTAIAHTSGQIILFFDLSLVSHSYTFTTVGNLNLGMYTTWTDAFADPNGSYLLFTNGTTLSYPPVELRGDIRIQVNQSTNVCALTQNASTSTFDNSELVMAGPGAGMFVESDGYTWDLYMYGSSQAGGSIAIADAFNAYMYDNGFLSTSNATLVTVNSSTTNVSQNLYGQVIINGVMTDYHGSGPTLISPDVGVYTYLLSGSVLYYSPGPGTAAWIPVAGQVLDLIVTPPGSTTFPLLLEQLSAGTNSFSRLYFAATPVPTVPAGTYNFGSITEWYSDTPGITTINFADGATSTPFPAKLESLGLSTDVSMTTSVFSAQNIVSQMYDANISYTLSNSIPFIDIMGQTLEWEICGASLLNSAVGSSGSTGIIDETAAGSTVTISLYGTTIVGYGLIGSNLLTNATPPGNLSTLKIIVYSNQVVIKDPALAPFITYGYPPSSIVFQPSGTAGANVYTDEVSLANATQSLNGANYTILFDLSMAGGTYTFATGGALNFAPNGTWTGIGEIIFANGTTLTNPPICIRGETTTAGFNGQLYVSITQTTTVCIFTGTGSLRLEGFTLIEEDASGAGAFIDVQGGGRLDVQYYGETQSFGFDVSTPLFTASAGTLVLWLFDTAYIGAFTSDSTLSVLYANSDAGGVDGATDNNLYAKMAINGIFRSPDDGTSVIPTSGYNSGAFYLTGVRLMVSDGTTWRCTNVLSGTTTLVNGVSPLIGGAGGGVVLVGGSTRIVATRRDPNGSTALGLLEALDSDRGGGGFGVGYFKIRSIRTNLTAETGDQSSVDWILTVT